MTKPPVIFVVDDPARAIELSLLVKKHGYTVSAMVASGEAALKSEVSGMAPPLEMAMLREPRRA